MAKGKKAVEIPPERVEEIRADARSGVNWAAEFNYGPACRCGLKRNLMKIGFGEDDGTCRRHPAEPVGEADGPGA